MTLGELKKLDLPDDTPILVPAPDHSYRECAAAVVPAIKCPYTGWSEDHEGLGGKRVTTVVVR